MGGSLLFPADKICHNGILMLHKLYKGRLRGFGAAPVKIKSSLAEGAEFIM